MTVHWYVHDILQTHVLPLMSELLGAPFQQHNVRPHTAWMSQDRPPPPHNDPTLTFSILRFVKIEHIWDHLGFQVGQPTCLVELEERLQQLWNEMSQDIIRNLYASMPARIASCNCARGGTTQS
ncbi:transposable element Tcb1 transposase [Trichonephila clavipes]|uniref:Transposable element Tcb1 transposase n=1 Tax=Trichonephila clavipes TaxID=2585209 RepID=A0A8X6SX07_TRICX|nr:transposable element Tcb1 transposase [Trichonephila clavipes]